MKWEGQRESSQIEDRREGGGSYSGGGGGFGGGRRIGLGTIAVALVAGWIFGINPVTIIGALSGGGVESPVSIEAPRDTSSRNGPVTDEGGKFISAVLASTEDVWDKQFAAHNAQYSKPVLVLYRGSTRTACGNGDAAMGPFYCPADQKVYLDLGFFDTMRSRLGAPGDFAQAYVVAHEVGHHVQQLMGISEKVERARQRSSEAQANAMSVRLELQADCLAGIWAHDSQQARQWLEQGDIEEALNAAAQIGDDTLQRQQTGTVVPESFTHGTSAQRMQWFKRGMQTGDLNQCNTFSAKNS